MKRLPRNRIIVGDARDILRTLPADTVDCAITSPPYFRLRNYQDGRQIGLETHVDDYTHELLGFARSLKRVLKPSGSLWLNLGDTYGRSTSHGAQDKVSFLPLNASRRLSLMTAGSCATRSSGPRRTPCRQAYPTV